MSVQSNANDIKLGLKSKFVYSLCQVAFRRSVASYRCIYTGWGQTTGVNDGGKPVHGAYGNQANVQPSQLKLQLRTFNFQPKLVLTLSFLWVPGYGRIGRVVPCIVSQLKPVSPYYRSSVLINRGVLRLYTISVRNHLSSTV
jgi:hypothetical protein